MEGFGTGIATSSICCPPRACHLPAEACPPPRLPLPSAALPAAPVDLHRPVSSTTRNRTSNCTGLKTVGLRSWPPASDQPGAPLAALLAASCQTFLCPWGESPPPFPWLPAVQELSSGMCTITFVIQPILQISLLCCPSVTIPSLLAVDGSPITLALC